MAKRKRIKYLNGIPHVLVRIIDHEQEVGVLDKSKKVYKVN